MGHGDVEGLRDLAGVVARAGDGHRSLSQVGVVAIGHRVVGAFLQHSLAVADHYLGCQRFAGIVLLGDVANHILSQGLWRNGHFVPVVGGDIVVTVGHFCPDSRLADANDGDLTCSFVNCENLLVAGPIRQRAVAYHLWQDGEVRIAVGFLELVGDTERYHSICLIDGERSGRCTCVVTDTREGHGARARSRIVAVFYRVVLVQHEGRHAVLNRHRGLLGLAVVGLVVDVVDGDVFVCQHLAVVHRDFGIGALHHECVGIGVALNGGQLEVLQQVDAGGTARGAGHGGIPLALDGAEAPVSVGRNLYGHGLSLCGRRHGVLAHLECNRSV